ncbi:hypothetical protein C6W88_11460 [Halomonas litopenaei]|uniref:YagK/YfjJ C-terminal domain-containing protein n=1 Tax=Halomonas litopenaei TaxID=2109328 RepID=A0ABX5IWK2_9GAMM|nr:MULTISPECIES: inovirus-type Gp2 protein [Halomonas]PTL89140.1 hypothetical protein C6W89_19455 [Halomonas sp. SYSU XM8]PTL94952.1 hypothetical protein C6W88_11460 [Halomonas litopenaei]
MSMNPNSIFYLYPKRHPLRKHLTCHWANTYRGYHVKQDRKKGPLVLNYLNEAFALIKYLQSKYYHTFGFRVDLHTPEKMTDPLKYDHNGLIRKFQDRLQAELNRASGKRSAKLHAIWAREKLDRVWMKRKRRRGDKILDPDKAKPHYHVLILVNGDAFRHLGSYKPTPESDGQYLSNTMAHRVIRAWAFALGNRAHSEMPGLVEFCKQRRFKDIPAKDGKPAKKIIIKKVVPFHIYRKDGPEGLVEIMYAVSYLCKAYSKDLSPGTRCFQTTQFSPDAAHAVWMFENEKDYYGKPYALRQGLDWEAGAD